MMKRKDVIKGLECCIAKNPDEGQKCEDCPFKEGYCVNRLKMAALKLLKEQEPLQPELEGGGRSYYMVCGDCHGIVDQGDHFCKHCGREIEWK